MMLLGNMSLRDGKGRERTRDRQSGSCSTSSAEWHRQDGWWQVEEGFDAGDQKLEETKKAIEDRMNVIEGSSWSGRCVTGWIPLMF